MKRIILILAAMFATVGIIVGTTQLARADASPRRLVTADANAWAMNRYHGGTGSGTPVIAYAQNINDANEDFAPYIVNNYVCGAYNTVHNGENGCWGPFIVGSGLNARYDGKLTEKILSYYTNWCEVIDQHLATASLQNCGSVGYIFVDSPVNGGHYMINVAYSNEIYQATQVTNQPYWLIADGYANQLVEAPSASNAWVCAGPDC